MGAAAPPWDGAAVRAWLNARIAAARAEQVTAERRGRSAQDECDQAAAEEMVCAAVRGERATADWDSFVAALKVLAERDDFVWRGVYDDARFDRHVRAMIRALLKRAKTGEGFAKTGHYQRPA